MRKMSDSALQILRERYFLRNDKGEIIEDWEGLCKRVSSFVASCEKDKEHWAKEFYDIIYNRLFLPNTPTLMNAATGCNTMAACFVLDIEDTMGNEKQGHSITDAWKAAALIGQAGGGIGYPLSKLRPRGDRIKTSGGKSTGPIPLILGVLNEIAEAVKQGGRRRIAQMGIMRVNHPDIIEFIQCKNQEGKINNFNISVGITDEFMDCLTNNKDFNLINPKDGSIHSTIKPLEIWKEIIAGAWLNGEPGVVFIDTINKYHNLKKLGTIEATNPCCVPEWVDLYTKEYGFTKINNVVGKTVSIWNGQEWSSVVPYHAGKVSKLINISVIFGNDRVKSVSCTHNHRFYMSDLSFKTAEELKVGDNLFPQIIDESGEVISTNVSVFSIEDHYSSHNYDPNINIYCVTEPKNGTVCFNGIITGNSEQPLLAYESCVLGSIDLGKFIEFGKKFDYDKYKNVIQIATRFLDNIVTLQISPISEIDKTTQANRKIGLGVMGFADALIKMEIPYGSSESYKIAEELGLCLKVEAHNESVRLAKEKGDSESSQYYENAMTWLDIKGTPRNACVTTQAPTGTIASIADASFGIEPLYDVCFIKNILDGKKIFFTSPIVKEFLEYKGYGKLCKEIESGKTLDELNLPKEIKDILVVSYKLTPEQHVKIQSAWQKYCDSAISKTVNMPNSATIDDVDKTYKMAYQLNCKGITVYRDGSRNLQVVEIGKGKQKKSKIIHRGDVVNGLTYRIPTSLGKMYLTINFTEDKTPIEIFISMSDISNDMQTMFSSLTRMISVSFKHSVPVKDVIKQLKRVKNGDTPIFYNEQAFKSFPQLIGHVLENIFLEDNKVEVNTSCNKCGGTLVLQEGCECCLSCGYSKC